MWQLPQTVARFHAYHELLFLILECLNHALEAGLIHCQTSDPPFSGETSGKHSRRRNSAVFRSLPTLNRAIALCRTLVTRPGLKTATEVPANVIRKALNHRYSRVPQPPASNTYYSSSSRNIQLWPLKLSISNSRTIRLTVDPLYKLSIWVWILKQCSFIGFWFFFFT